jgi:hypothetical protein
MSLTAQLGNETGTIAPAETLLDVEIGEVTVHHVIKQDPISVTLDGQAIFALTMALVLVIHFLETPVVEAVIALAPLALLIWNDYQNFINLGPGGTPATIQGYIRISWLRLWTLRDPLSPPLPDANGFPKTGILAAEPLPFRSGPRPVVAGIAPQRQVDQHGCDDIYRRLRRSIKGLCAANPKKLGTARSCFEKKGLALFALHPVNKTCQGEVCHVHDTDHSLHLSLHPDDIKELLEKGWGQRHPLAWKGWWGSMPVPETFVMLYSPRNEHELRIVCRIIEAAAWYVMGEQVMMEVSAKG